MPSCLSIWEAHLGYMCMIQLWIRTTIVTCSMTDDFLSLDFWPVVHPMPILGHIFRFGWDLRTFMEVTCPTIDDFMSFVLLTCRASDAHTGAYFPFQMRFMGLRLCRMIDDRWFYVARFSTCRASDAHTGAYFLFQMWFTDLHLCRMFADTWFCAT